MTNNESQIVYKAVEEITPYEKNAKKHPKKQVEQVADSIREFGFNQPVVIDKAGIIIVGHGRYLAATEILGMAKVPTICLDLDEEQAKSYRLADNKLNESEWDMELVISELKELTMPMLDLTGFSRDLLVDNEENDDDVPDTPEQPKSKLGDVYELGKHRIICGDSTDPETYKKLMRDNSADVVFTDPPYNVNYKGQGKNTKRTIENDHMDAVAFDSFLVNFFKSAVEAVKSGAGWYVFHSSSTQDQFKNAMEEAQLEVRAQLIWNKPTSALGWGDYRWKHEPFYYAGRKETKLTFYGDRTHKTVVDFHESEKDLIKWVKREKRAEAEGRTTIWSMKRDKVNEYVHPTQKPVELICYALVNSTKAEDIVLDAFLGSGSTLIAAHKTDRIAYGVELDPTFMDVIVQRWVDYTGETEILKNGEIDKWEVSAKVAASKEEVDTQDESEGDSSE